MGGQPHPKDKPPSLKRVRVEKDAKTTTPTQQDDSLVQVDAKITTTTQQEDFLVQVAAVVSTNTILYEALGKIVASFLTLKDKVSSTDKAFVIRFKDGRVVSWGDSTCGGDSSVLRAELKKTPGVWVDKIYSNRYAFVAKLTNGRWVGWGMSQMGGDLTSVQTKLDGGDVESVHTLPNGFIAQFKNKSLVSWGMTPGKDYVPLDMHGDRTIECLRHTLTSSMIKFTDGKVLFFHRYRNYGQAQWVFEREDVDKIYSTQENFFMKTKNNHAFTFTIGGFTLEEKRLEGLVSDIATTNLFAVGIPLNGGGVQHWGEDVSGKCTESHARILANLHFEEIVATSRKFTGRCADGKTLSWLPNQSEQQIYHFRVNAAKLYANRDAFAMILFDGSVNAWGDGFNTGADLRTIRSQLRKGGRAMRIYSAKEAFVVQMENGEFIAWGHTRSGG